MSEGNDEKCGGRMSPLEGLTPSEAEKLRVRLEGLSAALTPLRGAAEGEEPLFAPDLEEEI